MYRASPSQTQPQPILKHRLGVKITFNPRVLLLGKRCTAFLSDFKYAQCFEVGYSYGPIVTVNRHNEKMSEKKGENNLPDNEGMPRGFIHYYVYNCVASTETRGSGQIKGTKSTKKATPCGWTNLRKSKFPIESHHTPQAVMCPNCGNRPRLNAGMVEQDLSFVQEPKYFRNAHGQLYLPSDPRKRTQDTTVPDVKARKAWAENEMNRRNRRHLTIRSNAIEHKEETNEDVVKSFEDGGVLIE